MWTPEILEINRLATEQFIDFNPISIALIPRVKESDGAGGFKLVVHDPRDAQTFTLIEPGSSGYQPPTATPEGSQITFDFQLLGKYDAVIGEDDVFVVDGKDYRVATLMVDNGYEQRAMVIRHGW